MTRPASDALNLYLQRHPDIIEKTSRILVVRGDTGLTNLTPFRERVTVLQTDRAIVDQLTALRFSVAQDWPKLVDCALILATKHREETLCHIAMVLERISPGGTLIFAAENDLGATRYERDISSVVDIQEPFVKYHSRVVAATIKAPAANETTVAWINAGATRKIEFSFEGATQALSACPGIFSYRTIDRGSMLLASVLPEDLGGKVADLGSGYGFLSWAALRRAPSIAEIHLYESEYRAHTCATQNISRLQPELSTRAQLHWHDVTKGIGEATFDVVLLNPPFHDGKMQRRSLGETFFTVARRALKPGGQLYAVANEGLRYEEHLSTLFKSVTPLAREKGFVCYRGVTP